MQGLILIFCRAAFALCLLSAGAAARAQSAVPIDAGLAQHLLNRLGYGPAPGEVARVRALGAQAYVESQLAPPPLPPRLEERLGALSGAGVPAGEERLLRAIASPRQLEEVLVGFWLAHGGEGEAAGRAVRPHVLGTYADLRAALGRHAHRQGGAAHGGSEAAGGAAKRAAKRAAVRAAMRALVRHFVAAPSARLQEAVAREWERTGGDQRAVLRVLLGSPEFLAPAQWNAREKDGFRFVASAVRAAGLAVDDVRPLMVFARGALTAQEREAFVERLVTGRLPLAVAPVRPHEYASSAPPLRAGAAEASPGTVSGPGPVLMAAPTPSAAAMAAAARSRPAEPGRLRELLSQQDFLRY